MLPGKGTDFQDRKDGGEAAIELLLWIQKSAINILFTVPKN